MPRGSDVRGVTARPADTSGGEVSCPVGARSRRRRHERRIPRGARYHASRVGGGEGTGEAREKSEGAKSGAGMIRLGRASCVFARLPSSLRFRLRCAPPRRAAETSRRDERQPGLPRRSQALACRSREAKRVPRVLNNIFPASRRADEETGPVPPVHMPGSFVTSTSTLEEFVPAATTAFRNGCPGSRDYRRSSNSCLDGHPRARTQTNLSPIVDPVRCARCLPCRAR